jgi:hypothetical protein
MGTTPLFLKLDAHYKRFISGETSFFTLCGLSFKGFGWRPCFAALDLRGIHTGNDKLDGF